MQFYRPMLFVWIILAVLIGACSDDGTPPPTEIVVITSQSPTEIITQPTPTANLNDEQITLEATIVALRATNNALQLTIDAMPSEQVSNATQSPSESPTATAIPPTALPTETLRPSAFPTPRIEQVSLVEQVFENGRMLWWRDYHIIWVLIGDEVDPEQGEWLCFDDTFVEGDTELLPTFEPPLDAITLSQRVDIQIQQPIRGFGKLWRETEDIRNRLGWALTAEIEHSARREYIAGGSLDQNDNYTPDTGGEWRIGSFFNETLVLFEDEMGTACPSGIWRLRRPS